MNGRDGEAKLGDFLDGMKGRASLAAVRRLRKSCENPKPQLKTFLADVESYAKKKWELHHLPNWHDVSKLLFEFNEEGLLTDEEFDRLRYLPEKEQAEAGLGLVQVLDQEAFDLKIARLSKDVMDHLMRTFPQKRSRIEAAALHSFDYRYVWIRKTAWPEGKDSDGPVR